MSHPCERKGRLQRYGTSQAMRNKMALSPESFQVDDRELADFILFAEKYAKNIRFSDHQVPDGSSWHAFFSRDVSVPFAFLSRLKVQQYQQLQQQCIALIQDPPAKVLSTQKEQLGHSFTLSFCLASMLVRELAQHLQHIPEDHELYPRILSWCHQHIIPNLIALVRYAKGASSANLFGFNEGRIDGNWLADEATLQILGLAEGLAQVQIVSDIDFVSLVDETLKLLPIPAQIDLSSVSEDTAPFLLAPNAVTTLQNLTRYGLLNEIQASLFSACEVLKVLAQDGLASITEAGQHSPHYALWLSFLHLIKHPQAQINQFTKRHLDFYYHDVLQLNKRQAVLDTALLSLTLKPSFDEYLLKADILFEGDKDELGQVKLYQTLSDTVINQASIQSLHALQVQGSTSGEYLHVTPIPNSVDGYGEVALEDEQSFCLFGLAQDDTRYGLGLAIADEKLRLSDGQRLITLTIALVGAVPTSLSNAMTLSYSSQEGWSDIVSSDVDVYLRNSQLYIRAQLSPIMPAFTSYSKEIHGYAFEGEAPVLRIQLNKDSGALKQYAGLKYSRVRLLTSVSESRQIKLSNNAGLLDTSKAFMPFGARATKNDSLFVSSKEAFSKTLSEFSMRFTWQDTLDGSAYFYQSSSPLDLYCHATYLDNGVWRNSNRMAMPLFIEAASPTALSELAAMTPTSLAQQARSIVGSSLYVGYSINLSRALAGEGLVFSDIPAPLEYAQTPENYSAQAKHGCLKFSLQKSLGHEEFAQENALAMMGLVPDISYTQKTGINYDADLPKQPYTPVATDVSISYTTTNLAPKAIYTLAPFGHRLSQNNELFYEIKDEGALYIGLSNIKPLQSISLLFSMQEGSSDPLLPTAQTQWSYLAGDEFKPIDAEAIADTSMQLTGSGIVAFAIPSDASLTHTLMPADAIWIKMSVLDNKGAIAKGFSIHTQGLAVKRLSSETDSHIGASLAKMSISKTQPKIAQIKEIIQPQGSFSGKEREEDIAFRQRVSERLRHKDRASSMWDYEQLLLEQFPHLYRVRCLPHTELCEDDSTHLKVENALHPGSVVIVPLSKVAGLNKFNRPYTSSRILAEIKQYVTQRVSAWVNVEVINPKLEEIKLSFTVRFHDHIIDIGFYREQLNQAINAYLMPWSTQGDEGLDFTLQWHKSQLINFLDEQEYVDYVKDVLMLHRKDINSADEQWLREDYQQVTPTTAYSVLVSHPEHDIQVIEQDVTA